MSTNSHIGIINKDRTLETIYCHWDGYPSYMIPMLSKNYDTEEKVRELIALGGISSLRAKVKPSTANHTFDTPEPDVTVAYHRDRGEDWEDNKPQKWKSHNAAKNDLFYYAYLFDTKTNTWKYHHGSAALIPFDKVNLDDD